MKGVLFILFFCICTSGEKNYGESIAHMVNYGFIGRKIDTVYTDVEGYACQNYTTGDRVLCRDARTYRVKKMICVTLDEDDIKARPGQIHVRCNPVQCLVFSCSQALSCCVTQRGSMHPGAPKHGQYRFA